MVRAMPEHPPQVSRRRLLAVAGGAGLAATVAGCATQTAASPTSTSPGPSVPAAPTARPTPALLLCRDAWGARPARSGGKPHTPSRLTLHHAAIALGDNSNAPGRFRQDQRYHQDSLGWIDIAYHLGIDGKGNIYELRNPGIAGDTATDYDTTGHFLVICEGDFDKEAVSAAQLHGTALAFAWAAQRYNIATSTLAGHRDFAATSCPGANLYAHLSSGELKRQIDFLLSSGGVDLQQSCGADGSARVAAIEAGN